MSNIQEMKISAIYKIENTFSGRVYVGSAVNFANRKRQHLKRLNAGNHHSKKLQNAWNKYGEAAFVFAVVEAVERKEELLQREQYWIDSLESYYNIARVAGSPLGLKHSEATKAAMSLSRTGRKMSEETRLKMKEIAKGRVPPCSPEIIEARAQKLRGRKMPIEAVLLAAAKRKGYKHTESAKLKMSVAKTGRPLGPPSEEHRKKLSQAAKNRVVSLETRERQSLAAKKRGAPILSQEAIARGADKRRGAKRTPEQRERMRLGREKQRMELKAA